MIDPTTNTVTLEYTDHDALDAIAETLDGTLIRDGDRTLLTLPLTGLSIGRFIHAGVTACPRPNRHAIRPRSVRVPAGLACSPLATLDAWAF